MTRTEIRVSADRNDKGFVIAFAHGRMGSLIPESHPADAYRGYATIERTGTVTIRRWPDGAT